jgi:tetratricopeptide (TPR) repeat protein
MRKLFTVIMLLTAVAGYAQRKKKGQQTKQDDAPGTTQPAAQPATTPVKVPKDTILAPTNPLIDHFFKKYTLATRWNDLSTAKDALYDLIAETGNDSLAYTLAVYYYENQQYASGVLLTKDLLVRNPKNINLLQVSAACYEGLNLKDKALPNYETIYLQTNSTAILYKMAALQYEAKLYAESRANIDILLTKSDLDSLNVSVDEGNKTKQYPVKVSILNIKGLLAQQAGDKVLAKKCFQDALAIAPDFTAAKENLAKLK